MTPKKLLSFLAAMIMAISLLPTFSYAAPTSIAAAVDDYIYTVDRNGNATITEMKNKAITIANIPEQIDGKPVKAIGPRAFYQCLSLTDLTLPSGLTTISGYAFYLCNSLESVTIPANVTSIDKFAFYLCNSFKDYYVSDGNSTYCSKSGVLFDKQGKNLISCPSGKIGSFAIPSGTETIKTHSFSSCGSITSVTMPDTVKSIEVQAFYFCKSLNTANISKSVTKLNGFSFYLCNALTDYVVDGENPAYSSKNGALFNKDGTKFLMCPSGKSGSFAIPEGTLTIEAHSFYGCRQITSVTIPKSVNTVFGNPFAYTVSLNSVSVDGQNTSFLSRDGVLFSKDSKKILSVPNAKSGEYTIPDSVTEIGNSAFNSCSNLTSVDIPSSVTKIGLNAFTACSKLESITIPDGITEINNYAFNYCTKLENVVIPDSVTRIGDYAFAECYSFTSIIIPNKVTTIGERAFSNCSRLKCVVIPSSVTNIGKDVFVKDFIEDSEQANTVNIQDIYYIGSEQQWQSTTIDTGNTDINGKIIFITHTLPSDLDYDKNPKEATFSASVDDIGAITVHYCGKNGAPLSEPPINAGEYIVKIDIAASTNHSAVSGVTVCSFTIVPRLPTESTTEKTTAKVRRGYTLADAIITYGKVLGLDGELSGTFAWDDISTVISSDCNATMTFTPDDTNYAPLPINVPVEAFHSTLGGSGTKPTPTFFTVSFDTNGAGVIFSQNVQTNVVATEPEKPTKDGYIFDGWYSDKNLTEKYDFSQKVTKDITLYAKWIADESQVPTGNEWKNPFIDVKEKDWFFDNVKYVSENGLMYGTSEDTFEPQTLVTRGMFAATVYRLEGEPEILNKSIPFDDVAESSYCFKAVIWAQQNGIVSGISETKFAPDDNITREQLAAIFYRYAKYKGYDVSVRADTNILSYADFDEISNFAAEALQYAVGSGLITGKTETTLNPKDYATRAELAAMLQRFISYNK